MKRPNSLVVILGEPPEMFLLDEEVAETVVLGNRVFADSGLGDWVGFYDWLRTSDGEVVGVRSWVDRSEVERVCGTFPKSESIATSEDRVLIWFSDVHRHDESRSDDQDLGAHRILKSIRGDEIAITFSIESLLASEVDELASRARTARTNAALRE